MTTLPVPRGHLAVESDIRENDGGRRRAFAGVVRWQFGRALQSDHADAFDMNARGVPTDSAVGACAGVRARVGLLAAQARG
ncbi:hypothetical protein QCE73_12240 [Caballeronia sp. LZ029]|uniref:hypothetical protein n=1 Tax=Caballeronia sp. LZ029 TaxID=3038564 RepID=UPI00285E8DBD|nr:hypothetical protein [Caballeronia sp. LZ029]MDR5743922.1 hypothetical protein [Caballeronia sp. LZ029]